MIKLDMKTIPYFNQGLTRKSMNLLPQVGTTSRNLSKIGKIATGAFGSSLGVGLMVSDVARSLERDRSNVLVDQRMPKIGMANQFYTLAPVPTSGVKFSALRNRRF